MDEKIFAGYGVEIFLRQGKYFIRYDAGEIAIKMREDEITHDEAIKAQKSEKDAYEVLLACEQREGQGN